MAVAYTVTILAVLVRWVEGGKTISIEVLEAEELSGDQIVVVGVASPSEADPAILEVVDFVRKPITAR